MMEKVNNLRLVLFGIGVVLLFATERYFYQYDFRLISNAVAFALMIASFLLSLYLSILFFSQK